MLSHIYLNGNSLLPFDGEPGIDLRPFFILPADPGRIISSITVHWNIIKVNEFSGTYLFCTHGKLYVVQ